MNIIMVAQDGEFIDEYASLMEEQIKIWTDQKASLIEVVETHDHAFQEGTSIHGSLLGPQFGSGASVCASKYSLVMIAPREQFKNEEEDVRAATSRVRFAMQREDGTVDVVL